MTQFEYEQKMQDINEAMASAVEPLHAELHSLEKKKQELNRSIIETKLKISQLGAEIFDICEKIRNIRREFNDQKHLLYIDRPTKEG